MYRIMSPLVATSLLFAGMALAEVPEPHFQAQTIDDQVAIGYGVAVGDVDGDGRPDVLLADKAQIVWYRNPGEMGEPWEKFVMAENLTQRDNVCIAARDITGDGRVEVAVGAQWNPGETDDADQSGAIFYLVRPEDPTERWEPVPITPHDPTTHRMQWMEVGEGEYRLLVLPLHGEGNRDGEGQTVRLQVITPPEDLAGGEWNSQFVDTRLNMTHNLDIAPNQPGEDEFALVAGRQGIVFCQHFDDRWSVDGPPPFFQHGAGEIRSGMTTVDWVLVATIEPMHGTSVVAYSGSPRDEEPRRHVLDDTLNQGHALGVADFLGIDRPQIVAGWRMPNDEGNVGIRMYVPLDKSGTRWSTHTIDDNQMAAEDLAVADLNGNGQTDIVAAGRATNNLVIYWNRTGK